MVPIPQKWNKIAEKLQKIVHMRVPRNGKMCKDKWNVLNFDYKKLVHNHKGTKHLPSLWDLTMEKWEKYHLLC
jgi:hypothetical protein